MEELKIAISLHQSDTSLQTARIPTDDGTKILRACGNLVVRSKANQTVRLAHHTVRNFILMLDEKQMEQASASALHKQVHFSLPDADRKIGQLCLTFLDFSDFETQIQLRDSNEMTYPTPGQLIHNMLHGLLPTSSLLGKSLAYITGGAPELKDSKDVNLVLPKLRQRYKECGPIFAQYPLLEYISTYWPFHLDYFGTSTASLKQAEKQLIRRIAVDKSFLFKVRPWEDARYTSIDLDKYPSAKHTPPPVRLPLFRWAIETGASFLYAFDSGMHKRSTGDRWENEACISFEIQADVMDHNVLSRAVQGGSLNVVSDILYYFQRQASFTIPVKVLYHISRKVPSWTLLCLFRMIANRKIKLGEEDRESDWARFPWQKKHALWQSNWSVTRIPQESLEIVRAVQSESTRNGDVQVANQMHGLIIDSQPIHEMDSRHSTLEAL